MMGAETFYTDYNFLVPAFQINLERGTAGALVMRDVQEITFTDDMAAPGFFEFVLHDWDPVSKAVKYSSPWDAKGNPKKIGNEDAPNFEPGTKVSLLFGYVGKPGIQAVMNGEVVSMASSFPASGLPSVRIRAVDADYRELQRKQVLSKCNGTVKEIIQKLCSDNGYDPDLSEITEPGEKKNNVVVEGTLYDALASRAKDLGMFFTFVHPPERPKGSAAATTPPKTKIQFTKLTAKKSDPVAEFKWGRTLLSFAPVMSASAQVSQVIVRGANPMEKKDKRKVDVIKKFSDVPYLADALGPTGFKALEASGKGITEVIKPSKALSTEDAEKEAIKRLVEIANSLITASGTAIGLPSLRSGKTIKIVDTGARFDGVYRLTQTTHTIGASGYTTSFQARKEVLQ